MQKRLFPLVMIGSVSVASLAGPPAFAASTKGILPGGCVVKPDLPGDRQAKWKEEGFPTALEQQAANRWIKAYDLNDYGDAQGTAYTGGTPLFNEATGERVSRYWYLVQQHPEKPWNQWASR